MPLFSRGFLHPSACCVEFSTRLPSVSSDSVRFLVEGV
jgi:hypothetical protein